jgi:hypothetical protein
VGELIDLAEPNAASGGESIASPFRILQIQPQSAPAFGAIPAR